MYHWLPRVQFWNRIKVNEPNLFEPSKTQQKLPIVKLTEWQANIECRI